MLLTLRLYCTYTRTPQDMDGTLTLIFAKSETTWDIITKISASLQLRKKWILTKFGGCSSKNGPARSIRSFRHFWREIQIWRHLEPSYLVQSGYLLRLTTGENLVLISQTTFEKLKFEHFSLSIPSLVGIKIVFKKVYSLLLLLFQQNRSIRLQ